MMKVNSLNIKDGMTIKSINSCLRRIKPGKKKWPESIKKIIEAMIYGMVSPIASFRIRSRKEGRKNGNPKRRIEG